MFCPIRCFGFRRFVVRRCVHSAFVTSTFCRWIPPTHPRDRCSPVTAWLRGFIGERGVWVSWHAIAAATRPSQYFAFSCTQQYRGGWATREWGGPNLDPERRDGFGWGGEKVGRHWPIVFASLKGTEAWDFYCCVFNSMCSFWFSWTSQTPVWFLVHIRRAILICMWINFSLTLLRLNQGSLRLH
jgi:hypothetical protein